LITTSSNSAGNLMPIIEPGTQHSPGTILLVEYDMAIRTSLSVALSEKYTVLQSRDGVEAVRLFEKNAGNIFAVLTDLELPRLGGDILAEWIHSVRPDMPIIFIAGTESGANSFEELPENNWTWFLAKPFDLTDLETLIENAVAGPRNCPKPESDFDLVPARTGTTG
jgi:two-component system cell cycle sensor histidine kinase/response regulator CckA